MEASVPRYPHKGGTQEKRSQEYKERCGKVFWMKIMKTFHFMTINSDTRITVFIKLNNRVFS